MRSWSTRSAAPLVVKHPSHGDDQTGSFQRHNGFMFMRLMCLRGRPAGVGEALARFCDSLAFQCASNILGELQNIVRSSMRPNDRERAKSFPFSDKNSLLKGKTWLLACNES